MVVCSVIVPFQKGRNYLKDCLNSILAQDIPELEVLLVLDHAENVGDIIEEYSKKLNLLPLTVSGNGGVAEARNLGLRSASGKYIYFLDSDDYILEGSIAALYQKAETLQADITTGYLQEVWFKRDSFLKMREEEGDNATKVESRMNGFPGNPLKRIREDYFSVGNLLIKKSYLVEKKTTFVESLTYYSDLPFVMELLAGTDRIAMAEEAVYLKRMHNDTIHLPALDQLQDAKRPGQFIESYRLGVQHAYKSITLKEQLQLYFLEHMSEKLAGNVHTEVFSWSAEVKNAYRECLRDIPKELMRGRTFSEKGMLRAFAKGRDKKTKLLSKYVVFKKRKTGLFGSREQRRRLVYILFFRKRPVQDNWIVFESFLGRYYSDSCRALYEYILEHYPDKYKCIWAINEKERRKEVKGDPVIVKRGSIRYYFYVSQAKYWVNNMRQDIWLDKKPGMVFLETWHGTPLKKLFFDMEDVHSDGYRYKMEMYQQSRKWDYLVSDNPFSTEVFSSAFLFPKEKILEYGYPRNDILYAKDKEERAAVLKERLGLPLDKKVILYAPTWRDDDYYGPGMYKFKLALDLDRMQREFGATHCILVRTHHYIADRLDLQAYEGFAFNVSDYGDISELYLLTDICITDYSSVFFDFANLRRPILFYTYDMEKYRDMLRGFYIDMETELPGPLLYTNDEVLHALHHLDEIKEQYREKEEAFYKRFCSVDDGNACKRIYEKVFQAADESAAGL